jgi:DNA-binding winged helix-turn-helix (wHTH) protein/tetratricopeptide (TPR) repeat protein
MSSSASKTTRYRFGQFELEPAQGRLSRGGSSVKLQDLPFRLLVLLVEQAGDVVSREEVRQRLWPEDTFVEFDNSLGVAVRKLREALRDNAEAPLFIETVPRRGYRFVAPVTVHDSTVSDSKVLDSAVTSSNHTSDLRQESKKGASAVRSSSLHGRYWTIAALVLLMVGITVYEFRSNPRQSAAKGEATDAVPRVRPRRAVAVLGFRNLAGRPDDKWLSTAFTEMLNTELATGRGLRMVSGEDVARAKRELPLADEDTLAKATLERLRTNPGADVVVLGSYTLLPGKAENRIRLDLRMQDTTAGETIAEEALTGSEENLFELASQAGIRLRQSLGAGSSPTDISELRASLPSNQQAFRLYAEGRAKLWAFDFAAARDLLLKAAEADPQYPLVHSALANAWGHLGYSAKARAEAQRAVDLSALLSQEERLLVEGEYQVTLSNWPKAAAAYQTLFNLFPDSLDYGLRLASVQQRLKPADALATLAKLRHLPAPTGDDPRIDMGEASAWMNQDIAKAQAAAKRAIEKGTAQGSHLLVARAYGILCQTSPVAASSADVLRDCTSAQQSYAVAGDRNNEARTLNDFAGFYFQQGDLVRAQAMWRQAATEFRQVGDIEGLAATSNNIGDVLLLQGNLRLAKQSLEEALPNYQAIEDKDGVARVLNDLGELSREQGNLQAAETTYQQAKATAQEIDDKDAIAYILTGLGDVLTDRGDLAAARKSYEEALSIRKQAGEKQASAETQIGLARLAIEEGHATDAAAALHQCKEQFHKDHESDDELAATTTLTQALLAAGNHADAKKEIDGARALASRSQNRLNRLQFDLASARMQSATGQPELSRAQLQKLQREAQSLGFVAFEFDARLALAELEKNSQHNTLARTELTSLENTARAKGFDLVARKAAAAR